MLVKFKHRLTNRNKNQLQAIISTSEIGAGLKSRESIEWTDIVKMRLCKY